MRSLAMLRSLRPTDVERLVDALDRAFGERAAPGDGTGRAPPTAGEGASGPTDAGPRREDVYAEARRVFTAREAELRASAAVTERVVRQLRGELPTTPQQLLLLRAPVGGRAGGRVRIRNASPRTAAFAFRAPQTHGLRFSPARFKLPPGESQVVDVRLDLLNQPGAVGTHEVLGVDVLADGKTALKLWVEIELDSPVEGA